MPCTGREPLSSKATTGAGDGKWIANTAKTGKSRLPAATLAAECGNWLLRFQLQFAVIVMGAVVLSAYYSWGIAKSRHAPDTPDSAHTRMSHSAEANKSSLPAATEATECARWLVLTELLLTVAVVMDAYLALRLVKSKRAPDGPDAPSLTDRWATYAANTSKSWLSAATRAVQCARRPLRSRRLLAVVVMCAVVPTAYHELWVAKSTHVQDAPDSAHTWTTYSVGATKPSLPAAARAVECAGWRLLSQLLLVIVILIGACLGLCILKSKQAPDVPRTPSLTDTEPSLTSSSCAFWTLDSMRKDMWVKYGAPAIKLRLAAVTRALKYAGWFLRSQLLWAVIVIIPVVLTACYALWVFKHRHVPHSEDCVTIGGKTYCF